MDNSATSWFSELGMEDPFRDQCHVFDFFDEDLSAALVDYFQGSLSPEGNSSISTILPRSSSTTTLCVSSVVEAPPIVTERPAKQHKPNGYNSSTIHNMSSFDKISSNSPMTVSFGNPIMTELNTQHVTLGTLNPEDDAMSEVLTSHGSLVNMVERTTRFQSKAKKSGGRTRPPSQTYDHIVAERKRRQQLSQQFVALSAVVPGLKKMNKTSVLGDAIKYLKHLQERAKTLEEQATKQTMESVVLLQKTQLRTEDEGSSDEIGSTDELPLPEIEAKVCDKKVLLRVQCENHRGVLVKVLSEVQKLNLAVTNTSVAPFGSLALDITIIAEMEKEFNLTIKELAKSLRSALQLLRQES